MFPKRRKPTHPGIVLEEEFLKPHNISARQFAQNLGGKWTELKILSFIEGKDGLSDQETEEMATALGTSAKLWSRLMQQYKQWEQLQQGNKKGSPKPWKKAQ